jgi:hypothetical protein
METLMTLRTSLWMAAGVLIATAQFTLAADFSLKTKESKLPESVSVEIAGSLSSSVYEISKGDKTLYRFWFGKAIKLKAKPDAPGNGLDQFVQPSVLGVVEVLEEHRDYRDDELFENTFIIRYGIRPNDGNHLGTSDFRHFGVLVPAKKDTQLDGIDGYKSLVKASSFDTVSDHPVILSLRPVDGDAGSTPSLQEPAPDHHALRVKANGAVEGGEEQIPVVFDLVFEGFAEF